ncbi:MAG: class I SAM-dependent methyltransferase [Parcubacteria group bacterium]|nr:class I SAM-dependent methyltransferase [Parcubacteria group bacterium]
MQLENSIACPKCLGSLSQEAERARCKKCSASFPITKGVYFFEDAAPLSPAPLKPRQKWTKWRNLNFAYLQNKLTKITEHSLVLDIGAGPGQFRELYKNCRYVGMDFYPFSGVQVISDITKRFPFQENIFDYVVLSNVLEHLNEPKNTLRECFRVLKPGGRVIILVPFIIKVHQAPYDFLRYTHFMLKYLLERSYFSAIEISEIGNTFDLQRSFLTEGFNIHIKNIRLRITNRYMRSLLLLSLLAAHKTILGILWCVRRAFGDTINRENTTNIPVGYGAVAEKRN